MLIHNVRQIAVCGHTWNMPHPQCVPHYISSAPRPLTKQKKIRSIHGAIIWGELAISHLCHLSFCRVLGVKMKLYMVLYFVFHVIYKFLRNTTLYFMRIGLTVAEILSEVIGKGQKVVGWSMLIPSQIWHQITCWDSYIQHVFFPIRYCFAIFRAGVEQRFK